MKVMIPVDDSRENGIPFVGRVPYDRQASAAVNAGKSVAEVDCPASRAHNGAG